MRFKKILKTCFDGLLLGVGRITGFVEIDFALLVVGNEVHELGEGSIVHFKTILYEAHAYCLVYQFLLLPGYQIEARLDFEPSVSKLQLRLL